MIRCRAGDFFYTDAEVESMQKSIEEFKSLFGNRLSGFVIGCLKQQDNEVTIHQEHTKSLIESSRPFSVTFHKAFDLLNDPIQSLDDLIEMKVERVLTSGCSGKGLSGKVVDHLPTLKTLVEHSKQRIIILAGGGVRMNNVKSIIEETGVTEVHSSQVIRW
ncbi:copper homeostasis protein cutC [Acrasis kona]|uniref:Copper homeostasis protein cutC homolog n=1 Tax=Acrasis kona TaxID=1008807 RepID=A0AAW2ZCJ4_9EUKA